MPQASNNKLQEAYSHCALMVKNHYENFPVASLILPKPIRQPISVIYAFARTADDIADEGDMAPEARIQQLDVMGEKLDKLSPNKLQSGQTLDDPIFVALDDVIKQHNLPIQLFHDLLTAFRQDATKKRYATFEEILYYCRHSANPVGRLLLHLAKQDSDIQLKQSDAICSALQLINFYQDIIQDVDENNRIYFPEDEMQTFGVSEQYFQQHQCDKAMQALLIKQLNRAHEMMLLGAPLGNNMPGRFGLQLRMMINGGLKVLELLKNNHHLCFSRPRLNKGHWAQIIWYSTLKKTI